MRSYFFIFFLTLFGVLSSNITLATVHVITSSQNLITGENCFVTFVVEAQQTLPNDPLIEIKNAFFQLESKQVARQQGKRYYLYNYRFNSPNAGKFTIPKTEFSPNNLNYISEPVYLTVRKSDTLKKATATSVSLNHPIGEKRKTYTYYTQIAATKSSLYPNEATRIEYKIYIPHFIKVAQWGLPTGENSNATAWRFETPDLRVNNGNVVIDGLKYQVGRFHTSASGIKPGEATLGPFKSRIVHRASIRGINGFFRENQEFYPLSAPLELDIKKLPPNPPSNFKGDVGRFQMSVQVDSRKELTASESIKAAVTIQGTGKFSELTPPSLTNDEHWKLISQSKSEMGKHRKEINSFAEFSYLIQPTNTGPPTSTPGFSFSYLDQDNDEYRTLTYPGLPITVKLTTKTATDTTTETTSSAADKASQMLGIIASSSFTNPPWYRRLPLYTIHFIPCILCFLLLAKFAYQKYQSRKLRLSHKTIQRKSLAELEKHDGASFIKAASNYIQRWIDTKKHPELLDIPQLRDQHCYKPDESEVSNQSRTRTKLTPQHKSAVIEQLKKLILLFFFISPQLSDASDNSDNSLSLAETSWNKKEFKQALTQYKSQLPSNSPDLLYNIGNCYQKLNLQEQAALSYHRALMLDPDHNQARHNLTLLQKKNDSIISSPLIKEGSLEDWVDEIPLAAYYISLSLSLWLILLVFLYIKILKPQNSTPILLLGIFSLITASLAGYGYYKHPEGKNQSKKPFAIIATLTTLSSQPIKDSKTIITVPAISECHILSSRGSYTFIELDNESKTRGWAPNESILQVVK